MAKAVFTQGLVSPATDLIAAEQCPLIANPTIGQSRQHVPDQVICGKHGKQLHYAHSTLTLAVYWLWISVLF